MKVYLVGGAVRDELLSIKVLEKDWVVVGSTEEDLTEEGYKKIGRDFPVFLHPETKEEYALARKERKSGTGHKGFEFVFDPSVSLEEDLLRRDLTINAIAKDENGNLIDPYGGIEDIKNRKLKKVSSAFSEDPLRVLRVARFAAKLNHLDFFIEEETLSEMKMISRSGEIKTLSKERVWMETQKALATQSPQEYFRILEKSEALKELSEDLSPNYRSLQNASSNVDDQAIRWAALVSGNTNLVEINTAFNAPNEFREIAIICDQFVNFNEDELNAENLLNLILKTDLLRKPDRFFKAYRASNFVCKSEWLDEGQWKNVHDLIVKVKVDEDEKVGKIIAKKLHQDRLISLENFLKNL